MNDRHIYYKCIVNFDWHPTLLLTSRYQLLILKSNNTIFDFSDYVLRVFQLFFYEQHLSLSLVSTYLPNNVILKYQE